MKNKLLVLLCFLAFISCKKEEASESITVTYTVGEKLNYITEQSYFFDDTTSLNNDSVSYRVDSSYLKVEKDTLINGINCVKVLYNYFWGQIEVDYIQQKSDGNYRIAKRSYDTNEFYISAEPELIYPSNMNVGTHWGESPDGKNRRNEVIGNSTITTSAGKFNCVAIKYNTYPEEWLYNPNDKVIEYTCSKGIVKTELSSSNTVNYDGHHGKAYWTVKLYRVN